MITIRHLPPVNNLKRRMKSLAALDATLCPDWEYRYYSFNSNWSGQEQMGSIKNGSGDDLFVLYNTHGAFLKGFSHEFSDQTVSSEKFYSGIPEEFLEASKEPAFSPNNVSFCCWRLLNDDRWKSSVPENIWASDIYFLIHDLVKGEDSYRNFASDYYERDVPLGQIEAIYNHEPMTQKLAEALNDEVDYPNLVADLREIDYPTIA